MSVVVETSQDEFNKSQQDENKLNDNNEEWRPLHMHEVVAVAMVVKNWLRPRDKTRERLKEEENALTNEVNTSLVFEPMPITIERLRLLKEMGRSPSQSSFAALKEKISTASTSTQLPLVLQVENKTVENKETNESVNDRKSNGSILRENRNEQNESENITNTVDPERGLIETSLERNTILMTIISCIKTIKNILSTIPTASINPNGTFYACWTFLIYLVFLYNAFVCVLFVFDDTREGSPLFIFWIILNGICDFINLQDLLMNSRLSYIDDGMHVTEWKRLAKKYFHSFHFLMDFIALLPFDLILIINRGISLSRVNRLAKCYRVWQFVQMTNVRTNYPNAFRILHIVVVCVVLFHWNAALYFKISLIYGIFTTDASAWEFNYLKNQDVLWVKCGQVLWSEIPEGQCFFNESGLGDPDIDRVNYLNEMVKYWENRSMLVSFSNFSKQYSLSFYWSSLTLTTSGQQPYPTAAMHNSLEIFDTIVGVLVFAVIVGSVGNVVSTMNRGRAEIQQLNDGIKFYMKYRNVSATMQKRVLDCINYIQRHAQIQDESVIMGTIPPRLRGELAVHLHLENLRQVELFAECEPSLLYVNLLYGLVQHIEFPDCPLNQCTAELLLKFLRTRAIFERKRLYELCGSGDAYCKV
ncbi:hypothetical protein ACQ4LE_007863 [Meloidogyne hapla]